MLKILYLSILSFVFSIIEKTIIIKYITLQLDYLYDDCFNVGL